MLLSKISSEKITNVILSLWYTKSLSQFQSYWHSEENVPSYIVMPKKVLLMQKVSTKFISYQQRNHEPKLHVCVKLILSRSLSQF